MKHIFALFLLVCALPARAHDFHASLAEVEWNADARKIEVSLRLFPDDVEKALSRIHRRDIRIESAGSEEALARYVNSRFIFSGGTHRSRFKVVGTETRVDSMWLFLESGWSGGPLDEARVENSLLTELFTDQVNLVNLQLKSKRMTLTFNSQILMSAPKE